MKRGPWALALITVGAFAWRVSPFLRRDGTLGWPLDYDEGVYGAAAWLLGHGHWPYRDFFFAHPPGALWVLTPLLGWQSPEATLVVGRWLGALAGACTTALVGRLVARHTNWPSALFAALVYATWPEVVWAERNLRLEPWLNLACVAGTWWWFAPSVGRRPRLFAAAALGFAVTIKLWAALWLLGAATTLFGRKQPGLHDAWRFGLVATGVAGVACAPALALAPAAFIDDVVRFQSLRPPDGDLATATRLHELFIAHGPRGLVLLALSAWSLRAATGLARMTAVVWALVAFAFLGAPAFWNSYDAHFALPMTLSAAVGFHQLGVEVRWVRPAWVTAAVTVLCVGPGVWHVLSTRHARDEAQSRRIAFLKSLPADTLACAFEVTEPLAANRPPPLPLVDSYGAMLFEAVADARARHRTYDTVGQAFSSEAAQGFAREALKGCDVVLLGPRGVDQFQSFDTSRAWLDEHFTGIEANLGAFEKHPRAMPYSPLRSR